MILKVAMNADVFQEALDHVTRLAPSMESEPDDRQALASLLEAISLPSDLTDVPQEELNSCFVFTTRALMIFHNRCSPVCKPELVSCLSCD